MQDVLRRELKYRISEKSFSHIKTGLSYLLEEDAHNSEEGYMVRSLYFDTLTNDDFYDKQAGIDHRKKIRLRIYDTDDDHAKLELKEKQGVFQRKRSLEVSRAEAEELIGGHYECLMGKGDFGQRMYALMGTEVYRPVCTVQYERLAYISPTNDIRITFDKRLMSNEGNADLFDRDMPFYPAGVIGGITMEVKYNHFLMSYIKDMIDRADKMQVSSSKYCQCRLYGLGGAINE